MGLRPLSFGQARTHLVVVAVLTMVVVLVVAAAALGVTAGFRPSVTHLLYH